MKKRIILFLYLLLALAGLSFGILHQVQAETQVFTLPWSVMGAGGLGGTSGTYTITSTFGQPLAVSPMGGDYPLSSGFWSQIHDAITEFLGYLPLITR
jgi:hypothetical protein